MVGKPSVVVGEHGTAHYAGVARCASVWECPVCRAAIQRERAKEVTAAALWHRANRGGCYLLTLTVAHGMGDDLKEVRSGVAKAWQRVQRGAPWQRFKARIGFVGSVRALEVTHGQHGFHPHLHILLLAESVTPELLESWRRWLSARWQWAVEQQLGRGHRPSDRHGCDLRPSEKDDYLAKLGLEISDAEAKQGRKGNRSIMELAADVAEYRAARDVKVWKEYSVGIRGARMLTWSKGLRAEVGLGAELSDAEVLFHEIGAIRGVITLSESLWHTLTTLGDDIKLQLLERIEANHPPWTLARWLNDTVRAVNRVVPESSRIRFRVESGDIRECVHALPIGESGYLSGLAEQRARM